MNIRPQVKVFLDAAETLLSPALLTSPLNQDERDLVKMYINSLDERVVPDGSAPEARQQSLQL